MHAWRVELFAHFVHPDVRRQLFDLPPMTMKVTDHQLIARRCTYGTTTCGAVPEGV